MKAQRVIPRRLIAVRRHHTCLRNAVEHCQSLGRPDTKKTKGLEPHPSRAAYTTVHQLLHEFSGGALIVILPNRTLCWQHRQGGPGHTASRQLSSDRGAKAQTLQCGMIIATSTRCDPLFPEYARVHARQLTCARAHTHTHIEPLTAHLRARSRMCGTCKGGADVLAEYLCLAFDKFDRL
jgi:hypothetical protein